MHLYYDEAGRGPLAGPVAIGLLGRATTDPQKKKSILRSDRYHLVRDSKQLSAEKRAYVYTQIIADTNLVWSVICVSQTVIDTKGIVFALQSGIRRAIKKISDQCTDGIYSVPTVILDGNTDFGIGKKLGIVTKTIVKGDQSVREISAASILAKVTRDRYMLRQDKKYPQYGFATHKGYGTQHHRDAIKTYGMCPLHRKTFCKNCG